jgi:L-ascorbate metabolism protein UlaG (beta-lactamase superfamily)
MPDIPYEDRCYILTHYHSDHYGGLASYWKHGKIYCSHTTANLICNVLQVSEKTVCRVAIGETIRIKGAAVTFMEANHCPGAVILLFALDTGMNHLHTGDLRYCPAMKLYPALQGVKIDKVYLDTTYAHPKHTFMTQEESISKIVNLAKEFLSSHPDDGIIYMSAYNLGKERVVFALSDALDVPVYMDADKIHIMNQIPGGAERVQAGKFTNNPRVGRIHICQMGFLGTLFPYFKPNFDGIRQHMEELNRYQVEADGIRHYLDTPHCPMPLILHAEPSTAGSDGQPGTAALSTVKPIPMRAAIAFIPTGWADDGNYNKTHNVMTDGEVTVCTVPYSEHSNCAELVEFVRFLRPREVVPTVYSDVRRFAYVRVGSINRVP